MTEQQKITLYREMTEWNVRGNDAVRAGNTVQADKCYYRAECICLQLDSRFMGQMSRKGATS